MTWLRVNKGSFVLWRMHHPRTGKSQFHDMGQRTRRIAAPIPRNQDAHVPRDLHVGNGRFRKASSPLPGISYGSMSHGLLGLSGETAASSGRVPCRGYCIVVIECYLGIITVSASALVLGVLSFIYIVPEVSFVPQETACKYLIIYLQTIS